MSDGEHGTRRGEWRTGSLFIKMKRVDANGKRLHNLELEQQAGDKLLFVLNPGPRRKISHSSIWAVSEEAFQKAGPPQVEHRVGDCDILCYQDKRIRFTESESSLSLANFQKPFSYTGEDPRPSIVARASRDWTFGNCLVFKQTIGRNRCRRRSPVRSERSDDSFYSASQIRKKWSML